VGDAATSTARLERLIAAAIAAPSAENKHIVRFEPRATSIRITVAPRLLAGAAPHRIAFHELAFGAVIENLLLEAAPLGFAALLQLNPQWRSNGIIADIGLRESESAVDGLHRWIFARRTNRRLYDRRKVPDAITREIGQAATVVAGAEVLWLDHPQLRRQALSVIWRAERERFRCERLHAELFEAIRFDLGWKASADEGLPPGSLEIEPPFRPLFRALGRWRLQRFFNAFGAAELLGLRAGWLPAWSASHLAVLTVDPVSENGFIHSGRALQRLWLAATRHSLALQPFAAPMAMIHSGWVTDASRRQFATELARLSEGKTAAILFRLGYAQPPTVHAGRPSPTRFLVGHLGEAVAGETFRT